MTTFTQILKTIVENYCKYRGKHPRKKFDLMENQLKNISMAQIILPYSMLRPVRQDTVEYMELIDSIRDKGLLQALLVRPHPTREGYWELIDGSWRLFCLRDLDFSEAPCIVKYGVSAEDVLSLQIAANAVSYETKPIEFAEQMHRMMRLREEAGCPLTLAELSKSVNKSASWVGKRLKLLKLCEKARDALRAGDIGLGHAVVLARVNLHEFQIHFLPKAKEMRVRDFEIEIGRWVALQRSKKMGERRENRKPSLKPRLQSMDTLLMELDTNENISQIIVRKLLTTPLQGAKAMLEWVLNLDEESRTRQLKEARHLLSQEDRTEILGRQRYEELKALRIERKNRVKKERDSFTQEKRD